jgi:hypothetical protein
MSVQSPIFKILSQSQNNLSKNRAGMRNINRILFNRQKFKRDSYSQTNFLEKRREENERRQQLEDELEAPRVVTQRDGASQLAQQDTSKGWFERIIGFIGYLSAGWIMNNLPTWIGIGEEFLARIKRAGEITSGFFNDTLKMFNSFGNLLSATGENLSRFDFLDSSNKIKSALNDLNSNVGNMGSRIEEALGLVTTPLTEGKYSGKDIPKLGTEQTNEGAYPEPPPYNPDGGNEPVSGYGTKEQQALLKTIRFAEGTSGSTGYSMFFGDKSGQAKYGDLTKLSANEVEKLVTKFLQDPQSKFSGGSSAAVGAYQIIGIAQKARALGMDMNRKFDQSFQDEMALRLAAARGVSAEVLKREGLSDAVIKKLSPEWASFPGNNYNQPTKKIRDLQSTYQSSLNSSSQSQSQQVGQSNTSSSVVIQPKETMLTSGYGWRWGRMHYGVDIVSKNGKTEGTPVVLKKGGIVEYAFIDRGNMGMVLITHDDGTQSRYLHVNNFKVSPGQRVKAGQIIAYLAAMGGPGIGNATGPHLHFEYYPSKSSGPVDPSSVYNNYVSLGGKVISTPNTPLDSAQQSRQPTSEQQSRQSPPTQVQSQTPAQISPPASPQGQITPFSITPERRGPDIIIAQPRNQQQTIVTSSSEGQSQQGSSISDIDLLNNFIKNKLLLDLTYL